MYSRDELFLRLLECHFCVFDKHQNKPLVSAEAVRHPSTYIILYTFRLLSIWKQIYALIMCNDIEDD